MRKQVEKTSVKEFVIEDIKSLYSAFLKLCDYIEENDDIGCSNCPLWKPICGNSDKNAGREFGETLQRIRHTAGIADPF